MRIIDWNVSFCEVVKVWKTLRKPLMLNSHGWQLSCSTTIDRLRVYSVPLGVVVDFERNPSGGPWIATGRAAPVPSPLRERREGSYGPNLTYHDEVPSDVLSSFVLAAEVTLADLQPSLSTQMKLKDEEWEKDSPLDTPEERLLNRIEDMTVKLSVQLHLASLHERATQLNITEVTMSGFIWYGRGTWHDHYVMFTCPLADGDAHPQINIGYRRSIWAPMWRADYTAVGLDSVGAGYDMFIELFEHAARRLKEASVMYSFQLPDWAANRIVKERPSVFGGKLLSNGTVGGVGFDEEEARADALIVCKESGIQVEARELVMLTGDTRVKPFGDKDFTIKPRSI